MGTPHVQVNVQNFFFVKVTKMNQRGRAATGLPPAAQPQQLQTSHPPPIPRLPLSSMRQRPIMPVRVIGRILEDSTVSTRTRVVVWYLSLTTTSSFFLSEILIQIWKFQNFSANHQDYLAIIFTTIALIFGSVGLYTWSPFMEIDTNSDPNLRISNHKLRVSAGFHAASLVAALVAVLVRRKINTDGRSDVDRRIISVQFFMAIAGIVCQFIITFIIFCIIENITPSSMTGSRGRPAARI
jgi:uncharacterized membrane protein YidH (DUF202 family)